MTIVLCLLLILLLILLPLIILFVVIYIAKNNNTYKNQMIILDAIYEYCKHENMSVYTQQDMYRSMKSYDDTFNCFWDWGYKNILPPEKFKLVEPYINTANK